MDRAAAASDRRAGSAAAADTAMSRGGRRRGGGGSARGEGAETRFALFLQRGALATAAARAEGET